MSISKRLTDTVCSTTKETIKQYRWVCDSHKGQNTKKANGSLPQ